MKQASRWVTAPASPQWGLNWNVFIPLSLKTTNTHTYGIQNRPKVKGPRPLCALLTHLLAQLVEPGDVCVHVVNPVGVWWALHDVPLFRLGALCGEHVTTVFGLIIHAVKPCNLHTQHKDGWANTRCLMLCRIYIRSVRRCWALGWTAGRWWPGKPEGRCFPTSFQNVAQSSWPWKCH